MEQGKIAKRAKRKIFKRKFRLGDNEKEIVKMIGLGTLVLASFALPNLPIALKPLIDRRGMDGIAKLIKKLSNHKVIDLGGEKIALTSKGQKLLKEIQIRDIEIIRPQKWDGIWHLVSYDIPKEFNKERDVFRYTLKRWGFYQIQYSLWVFPYDCREEVAVLAEYLKIPDYIVMMKTDFIPNEDYIESLFNI